MLYPGFGLGQVYQQNALGRRSAYGLLGSFGYIANQAARESISDLQNIGLALNVMEPPRKAFKTYREELQHDVNEWLREIEK